MSTQLMALIEKLTLNELAQNICFFCFGLFYLLRSPFTKVEESFSLQAIHDYLFAASSSDDDYGDSKFIWDHTQYPGVVHRTFVSPLVVSLPVKLLKAINPWHIDKWHYQLASRTSLLLLFVFAHYLFNKAVTKTHGARVTLWISLLILSQFHVLFYASRTLPNTFAYILVLLVYTAWQWQNWNTLIVLVAFTVLVVRFETILLFGFILLVEIFYTRNLTFTRILLVGIPAGLVWLAMTIFFDSYMWNKWIWPEGDCILFNIVHNQSHQWGVQPFLWYFYSALPRLLLSSLALLVMMPTYSLRNKYSIVAFAFVFVYSFLPHKELRFIIYVVPLLNICIAKTIVHLLQWMPYSDSPPASQTNDNINIQQQKISTDTLRYRGLSNKKQEQVEKTSKLGSSTWLSAVLLTGIRVVIIMHLLCNLVLSQFMFYLSSQNYPGGHCMMTINRAIQNETNQHNISVYVTNLAAQTGFTRFMELDQVYYNKEPKLVVDRFVNSQLLYLALEPQDVFLYLHQCDSTQTNCRLLMSNHQFNPIYFECNLLENITAFDRLDVKQFQVKYRVFLHVYKCIKHSNDFVST